MGDQLKDLEKLAELKDRGVLSDAEFEAQKRALLGSAAGNRQWTVGRVIKWMVAAVVLIPVVAFIGSIFSGVKEAHKAAGGPPVCEDAQVQQKVIAMANLNAAAAAARLGLGVPEIRGLLEIQQLHFDEAAGDRLCVAKTKVSGGTGVVGYSVVWQDKENRLSNVQIENYSDLISKYGPSATQAVAVAEQPSAGVQEEGAQAESGAASAQSAQQPSFDCAKAASSVEKSICGSAELAGLDVELVGTYRRVLAASDEEGKGFVKTMQRDWLTKRNQCQSADCLAGAYSDQIEQLSLVERQLSKPAEFR